MKELRKMLSLIERIEKPSKRLEFLLTEGVSERVEYDDFIRLFMENDIINGSFVSLGYFNYEKINKTINPSVDAKTKADKLISMKDEINKKIERSTDKVELLKWEEKLSELVNSPEWVAAVDGTAKKKTIPNPYQYIVSFKHFLWGWQNNEALANSFQRQKESEMNLRKKYGFGREESEYQPDDWRQRYGGVGLQRQVADKDVNKTSTYLQGMGGLPLYGDVDVDGSPRLDSRGVQRMTLRQNMYNNIKTTNSQYFLVKDDGKLEQVPKNFNYFFAYDIKKTALKAKEELDSEELSFKTELDNLNGEMRKLNKQFITDRIAYIVATIKDEKTKEKKSIYWINKNVDLLNDSVIIDKSQTESIINHHLKISIEEVKNA